eukprot:204274-Rhodomonas_salina.1
MSPVNSAEVKKFEDFSAFLIGVLKAFKDSAAALALDHMHLVLHHKDLQMWRDKTAKKNQLIRD